VSEQFFHAARKWAGWDVTPSGEVKAPFGLEWRDDPGDSAVGIRDAVVLDVGPVFCFYTPPSKRVDITIGGTGTVEERLRVAHAALSDHIRRGEGETDDRASMWETTAMCEGARREQAERERDEARDREIQHLARAEKAEELAEDRRHAHNEIFAALQKSEASIRELESSAPDLTELREALKVWNDEGPWTASEQLAAAVQRLVGK
jgi:hypothetical protein